MLAVASALAGTFAGSLMAQDLNGAGATFPYPIYSKWFSDYATTTGVKINYQSIGSGGGIRQLTEGTVDFGASDAPMSDAEMAKLKAPVLHFPTVLGAVVITYNIPGVTKALRLTGPGRRRHLRRQDHEVERRADRLAQQGNQASRERHSRGASLRRQRHHLHLLRLSVDREPVVGAGARKGEGTRVARRTRRQGQRGRRRSGEADAGRDRLRRAGVREAEFAARSPTSRTPNGEFVTPTIESVTTAAAARGGEAARQHGLSYLDRERERQGRVSDLLVHLPAGLSDAAGRREGEEARRLPPLVPAQRREERRRRSTTLRSPRAWSRSSRSGWAQSRWQHDSIVSNGEAALGRFTVFHAPHHTPEILE